MKTDYYCYFIDKVIVLEELKKTFHRRKPVWGREKNVPTPSSRGIVRGDNSQT